MSWKPRGGETCRQRKKNVAKQARTTYVHSCPISHVPVVVCQSVGIRTRGRTAAKGRRSRGSLRSVTDLLSELERPASLSRDAVEGDFVLCNRDWQPEANRRTSFSTWDATLSNDGAGFFGLCWLSNSQREYRRGLSFIARCAVGSPPTNPRQHLRSVLLALSRLHRVPGSESAEPSSFFERDPFAGPFGRVL